MKHISLLLILFYLGSCVQGEQKSSVSLGATVEIIQPSQYSAPGYPPPSPVPPEIAFAPTPYPFSYTTPSIPLKLSITNSNNLPYTIKWLKNGVETSPPNNTDSFTITPSQYPLGTNTVSSVLYDSSGNILSTLTWSFQISSAFPSYDTFSPSPSPSLYPGLPIAPWDANEIITVDIVDTGGTSYYNIWYLDGVVYGTPNGPYTSFSRQTFTIQPASLSLGSHTIVSQLSNSSTPGVGTIFGSATWNITIANVPQFSSFTDPQLPAPAAFPDIDFGSATIVNLDPEQLSNPENATFTIYWIVDGATDTTATFYNPGGLNLDPPAFIVNAASTNVWDAGNHSVQALLYDPTNKMVDSAFWAFEILYPPATTIDSILPSTATYVSAVQNIALDSTLPGFFQGTPTNSSRGTPILASGTNAFCVGVVDGRGVGYASFPTIAGVQIQFKEGTNGVGSNDLTGALVYQRQVNPADICLGTPGANPGFLINLLAPGQTYYLTANVMDILSLQTVGYVNWTINVVAPNTAPVITKSVTPVSVTQNATATFAFTVADQDGAALTNFDSRFTFSSSLAVNIPLDGTTTYYGNGIPPNTPNCLRDYSYAGADKFTCTITIPAANGNSPAPAAGTFTVSANVNNLSIFPNGAPVQTTPTNLYNPQEAATAPAIWSFSVIESNVGAPTLQNILLSGAANPATQTYMFVETAPLIAAVSASETQSIGFSILVNDLEKDNFRVKLYHNTAAATATFTEYFASPASPTFTIADATPPLFLNSPTELAIFYLNESIVTGAAGATITFRVVLTDVPEIPSTIPKSSTTTFNIWVNNYNPPPSVASATYTLSLGSTATVMEGFPYTFNVNPITDASTSDGNGLLWQWMVLDESDCASASAGSGSYVSGWKSITGATQSGAFVLAPSPATLTWSSPSGLNLPPSCPLQFRNCIGDNGFGNPATAGSPPTCPTTIAGPWVGPIYGIGADQYISTGANAASVDPSTAIWADPADPGMVYGVHVDGNVLTLASYFYDADTTITSSFNTFPSDSAGSYSATSTEGAYDISLTGNDNNIFVSYVFNRVSTMPPYVGIPTSTVVRIAKANMATATLDYFVNDDVVSGLGQVVANNSAFWQPYINSSGGNVPSVLYGDGQSGTATFKASLGLGISAITLQSRTDHNNNFYLAAKLPDGTVNLYKFGIPGTVSAPTISKSNLDIFYPNYVPFDEMTMAVGASGTNPYVFVAGKNTNSNTLFYTRKDLDDLDDNAFYALGSTPTEAFNDLGANAIASTVSGEFILGVIKDEVSTATVTNVYLLKIKDSTVKVSRKINVTPITNPRDMENSGDFAITEIIPQFTIGTSGAVPTENTKNTLWFRYQDNSRERNVIVNIQDEKFSNSSAEAKTDLWGQPWFRAP